MTRRTANQADKRKDDHKQAVVAASRCILPLQHNRIIHRGEAQSHAIESTKKTRYSGFKHAHSTLLHVPNRRFNQHTVKLHFSNHTTFQTRFRIVLHSRMRECTDFWCPKPKMLVLATKNQSRYPTGSI